MGEKARMRENADSRFISILKSDSLFQSTGLVMLPQLAQDGGKAVG
jgi:hypothetical protein